MFGRGCRARPYPRGTRCFGKGWRPVDKYLLTPVRLTARRCEAPLVSPVRYGLRRVPARVSQTLRHRSGPRSETRTASRCGTSDAGADPSSETPCADGASTAGRGVLTCLVASSLKLWVMGRS